METTPRVPTPTQPPAGRPVGLGIDEPQEQRPGVPMEVEPSPAEGVHWETPARQPARRTHLRRKGLKTLTPVFGTAQPPRGISGLMRHLAYRIPEHRARHWAMLLTADRVDVLEDRLGGLLARPLRNVGLEGLGSRVQRNPLRALLVTVVAGYLVGRALR